MRQNFLSTILAVYLWTVASGDLLKVILIMRHGDRTTCNPLFPTELDSTEYTNGLGNITELGRMEGYEIGLSLRNMYQSFLTNNTQEVLANSSDYSRCIITTGCALIGMYTPDDNDTCINATGNGDIWPVNVAVIPLKADFVLDSANCDLFKSEKTSNETLEANSEYLQQYNETVLELANYTGYENISDGGLVFLTYDNLLVEKIHNLTWQYSWVDPMWSELEAAAYPAYFLEYTTNVSRKVSGGPILNEIVQRVQEGIKEGNTTTKLHIYGTHDTIITPLLMLLDSDNQLPPPYTATVVVEVHDNNTVRLMYINATDQPPLNLSIPGCGMYCPVDQFVNFTSPFVVADPAQECQTQQNSDPNSPNYNPNANPSTGKNTNTGKKLAGATLSIFFCLLVAIFLL